MRDIDERYLMIDDWQCVPAGDRWSVAQSKGHGPE
jgi:hypothetical protein